MRRSSYDQAVIQNEAGQFLGIAFGADATTEHEIGIADLREAFGMPGVPTRECYGADARTVTTVPSDALRFFTDPEASYLVYTPSLGWRPELPFGPTEAKRLLSFYGHGELVTSWSNRDFGVRLGPDPEGYLGQLHQAILNQDAMFFLSGPDNPFSNPGLHIVIRSRVSPKHLEIFTAGDLRRFRLREAADATGIAERLKAAGKRYYALSPRWASDAEDEVVFLLNPADQDANNWGTFTVQDLDDWIAGKGKILKTSVTA